MSDNAAEANPTEQSQGGIKEMTSIEEKLIGRISAQLTRAVEEANLAYEFAPTVGSRIIQRKRVSL
jgi:hypothetical protein